MILVCRGLNCTRCPVNTPIVRCEMLTFDYYVKLFYKIKLINIGEYQIISSYFMESWDLIGKRMIKRGET